MKEQIAGAFRADERTHSVGGQRSFVLAYTYDFSRLFFKKADTGQSKYYRTRRGVCRKAPVGNADILTNARSAALSLYYERKEKKERISRLACYVARRMYVSLVAEDRHWTNDDRAHRFARANSASCTLQRAQERCCGKGDARGRREEGRRRGGGCAVGGRAITGPPEGRCRQMAGRCLQSCPDCRSGTQSGRAVRGEVCVVRSLHVAVCSLIWQHRCPRARARAAADRSSIVRARGEPVTIPPRTRDDGTPPRCVMLRPRGRRPGIFATSLPSPLPLSDVEFAIFFVSKRRSARSGERDFGAAGGECARFLH